MSGAALWSGRVGLLILGYLAAVVTATAGAVIVLFLISMAEAVADPAAILRSIRQVPETFMIGLIITVQAALPGFLAAAAAASILGWVKPWSYTLAGGLNGAVSIVVFNLYTGTSVFVMPPGLLVPCVIGGLAGGFVFYLVCGRRLGTWRGVPA